MLTGVFPSFLLPCDLSRKQHRLVPPPPRSGRGRSDGLRQRGRVGLRPVLPGHLPTRKRREWGLLQRRERGRRRLGRAGRPAEDRGGPHHRVPPHALHGVRGCAAHAIRPCLFQPGRRLLLCRSALTAVPACHWFAVPRPINSTPECPMFEIWFRESDASNPEVMFFCSRCGCPAESHPIDSQWAQREHQRRASEAASREALRARRRAAGDAGRAGSGDDPLAAHFRELGLKPGATLQEVCAVVAGEESPGQSRSWLFLCSVGSFSRCAIAVNRSRRRAPPLFCGAAFFPYRRAGRSGNSRSSGTRTNTRGRTRRRGRRRESASSPSIARGRP